MKTVLVTGATSGFGQGLVVELLKRGYSVVAAGRDLRSRNEIFKNERTLYGARLEELNLDITKKEEVLAMASLFKTRALHVLINNAGFGLFGPAEEVPLERLRYQLEVNFFGLVSVTQKLLPTLRNNKGHIINFSSILGLTGLPFSSSYCASKFAVEGFSEALSMELKSHGVKVSVIEPGGYPTQFTQSMEWGGHSSELESPYASQLANFFTLSARNQKRTRKQDPKDVINGVCRIIASDSSNLGAIFGADAKFIRIVQRLLPRNYYIKTIGPIFEFLLRK